MTKNIAKLITRIAICCVIGGTAALAEECAERSPSNLSPSMLSGACSTDSKGKIDAKANLDRVKTDVLAYECQNGSKACDGTPACKWRNTFDPKNPQSGIGCDPAAFRTIPKGGKFKAQGLEFTCNNPKGCCAYNCPVNYNACEPCSSGSSSSSGGSNSSNSSRSK